MARDISQALRTPEVVLLDLREAAELAEQGAYSWSDPRPSRDARVRRRPDIARPPHAVPTRRRDILYCASGGRSALACRTLRSLGYANLGHLDGGLKAWKEASKPVQPQL